MALTSDDLNSLIFRYLVESGFSHSAFTFGNESRANVFKNDGVFSNGALVDIVQRGIRLKAAEAQLASDANDASHPSSGSVLRARDGEAIPGMKVPQISSHRHLDGHTGDVVCVAWQPSGEALATGSQDGNANVWHLKLEENGHPDVPARCDRLQHFPPVGDQQGLSSICWTPDGKELATGALNGSLKIWSWTGALLKVLLVSDSTSLPPITALRYSPSGAYLLATRGDGQAAVFDASSYRLIKTLSTHKAAILDGCWVNASAFATASTDKTVHLFSIAAPTLPPKGRGRVPLAEARAPVRLVKGLATARAGSTQPRGGGDGGEDGDQPQAVEWQRTMQEHSGHVNCVAASPSGTLLATCSDDHTAMIWHLAEAQGKHVVTLVDPSSAAPGRTHDAPLNTCRFRPAGAGSSNPMLPLWLATCAGAAVDCGSAVEADAVPDSTVKLWDCGNAALLHTLSPMGAQIVWDVAWTPSGMLLATITLQRSVHVWDAVNGNVMAMLEMPGKVCHVAWHEDETLLAVGMTCGRACVASLKHTS